MSVVRHTRFRCSLTSCLSAWSMVACAPAVDRTMPRAALHAATPEVRLYAAPRSSAAIVVDGRLDDAAWAAAPWTEAFVDIEGDAKPRPRWNTRVRMLWNDTHWFLAAELEDPDLWATITQRDAVIFQDNDFELFVDPDDDTHRYFELEINALGAVWDLFLPRPYRDGGHAVDGWDIAGLQSAVHLDGTLNDGRDRDRGWTVELAIPWTAFTDSGRTPVPPRPGDTWRVNFSRVHWPLDRSGSGYSKRSDPVTGRPLPENNWVWSPQGAINMHMPEMWGVVQFGEATTTTVSTANEAARWALRRLYYAQRGYRRQHHRTASSLSQLGLRDLPDGITMSITPDGWQATIPVATGSGTWHIRADGLTWHTPTSGGSL